MTKQTAATIGLALGGAALTAGCFLFFYLTHFHGTGWALVGMGFGGYTLFSLSAVARQRQSERAETAASPSANLPASARSPSAPKPPEQW